MIDFSKIKKHDRFSNGKATIESLGVVHSVDSALHIFKNIGGESDGEAVIMSLRIFEWDKFKKIPPLPRHPLFTELSEFLINNPGAKRGLLEMLAVLYDASSEEEKNETRSILRNKFPYELLRSLCPEEVCRSKQLN